ncbi:MAG TPA: hypothetical protein DEV93_21810 [Chloroflexi bacterium]|nr:hypothetical protein [Chloroflexota bacterium]
MTKHGKEDAWLLGLALGAAIVGSLSTKTGWRLFAWAAVLSVDLYLLAVLVFAALQADDKEFRKNNSWVTRWFPRRTAGVFVMFLLFVASVTGFGGLYVGSDVFPKSTSSLDSLYYSVLILGFSDFSPRAGYGQVVVLCQLMSGIVLLIGAFPLLISRLSTFGSPDIQQVVALPNALR